MFFSRRQTDVWDDKNNTEFVVRQRFAALWQMVLLFIACYILILFISLNTADIGGAWGAAIALAFIIAPVCWVTVYLAQYCRDMLLATEFQNLMFASALRLKTKFCLIVQQNGDVVYLDPNFQKLFPETANRGTLVIDKIFTDKHIAPVESRKLFQALDAGQNATVFINIDNGEESERVVVTIDPLDRPKNYFVLRGRKYYTKKFESTAQTGNALSTAVPDSTAITLSNMLHTLPFGLITTDMDGHVEFANYQLERWLGYEQQELSSRQMRLHDLLARKNTPTTQHLLLKDCSGDVILLNKRGREKAFHVEHKVSRNAEGQATGCIMILRESDMELTGFLNPVHLTGNGPSLDARSLHAEPVTPPPPLEPAPRLAQEPNFMTPSPKEPSDDSSL